MFNPLSLISGRFLSRHWHILLSFLVTLGVVVGFPVVAGAFSWADLILQGVQVIQVSNISDRQEVALGKQINDQLVSSGQIKLYDNSDINQYVQQIGQRLVPVSDRPKIPYTFQVVDDNSVNAFATMGGFVYVHRGLLKEADNEAQVASVLAHEMGHIAARHSVKKMRQALIAQGAAAAAGVDNNTAVKVGLDLAIQRPTSRGYEFEADQRGLKTIGRSGYAESGMVDFMKKLLKQPSPPTFLSDHPATADRVIALQNNLDPAKANGDGLDNSSYQNLISSKLN